MRSKYILIADDCESLLGALRIQLEARGYEVTTCTDAYMALANAQKRRPDAMLLDIRMPAGDGFSVLERMAKLPELKDVPVIYITGDKSEQLDLRAEKMGASGVIHKPINLTSLLSLLDSVMDREKREWKASSASAEPQLFEINGDINIADIPGVNYDFK